MPLRKHDLLQMDARWLKQLPAKRRLEASIRRLDGARECQDRLNQNPATRCAARIDPPEGLWIHHAATIERLRQRGEAHPADAHDSLGTVIEAAARAGNSPRLLPFR